MIAADPSRMAPPGPSHRSVTIAPSVANPMTRIALGPKFHTAAPTTGMSVTTTVHMIFGVESGALR